MARHIDKPRAQPRQVQMRKAQVNRDAARLLFFQPVRFDPGKGADQGGFAMVDMTRGADDDAFDFDDSLPSGPLGPVPWPPARIMIMMLRRRVLIWAALIGAVPLLAAANMQAPQQPAAPKATFRADVSEVRVDVQVLDGKKIISGLGPVDFQISDEGQPQTLLRFGEESEPVALVILIDVSGSMKKYARQLASAAQAALTHLQPQDRVSVMVFSRGTELLSEFSNQLEEVAREIEVGVEQHRLPSGTAIYNSVLEASRLLATDKEKNLASRRAVLILTDNASLNYQITESQVLRELWGVDAVLNALVTDNAERPKLTRPGAFRNPDFTPTDIFKLADQTGGEAYRVERADRAFPQIMERLRSRYTVIYRPPPGPPGVFRSIKVELSPAARRRYPGARIRTRAGYYTAE